MILNRTIVDGKVIYKEISFDAAVALDDKTGLVFTDEDEKDDFYDYLDELESDEEEIEDEELDEDEEEVYEASAEEDEEDEKFFQKIGRKLNDLGDKIEKRINKEEIKATFSSIADFFKDESSNPKSKMSRLYKMIPYMDEEDLHEVALKIVDGDEEYKGINLVTIMPFFCTDDCDLLFINAIEKKEKNKVIRKIVPFVSKECLSKFTNEYIKGNYQYVNIDCLYPFMDAKDIKRIFKYIINKDEK
ncbi:MAG: hypothetical protein J5691_02635 [Bacilli bacterium]|nr:hypothetical protein [Bacilli bacterium]